MSVVRLPESELRLVRLLKSRGALEDMHGHKVPDRDRVAIVMCGDGHQTEDLLDHNGRCGCGRAVRHLIAVNGGATRIRCKGEWETDYLGKQITAARKIKDIGTVILVTHAPCGAAMGEGMTVIDVLRALLRAKQIVRDANPDAKVIGFFHLAYYDDKDHLRRRTYYVNGKELRAYLARLDREGGVS